MPTDPDITAPKRDATQGWSLRQTCDLGAARDWLNVQYTDHDLRCDDKATDFDFLHASAPIKHGSANLLQYGGAVKIEPKAFPDFYMLEMPLHGGVDLSMAAGAAKSSAVGCALFIPPRVAFAARWRSGTQQFMLKLNAGDVQKHWRMLMRDDAAQLPAILPIIEFESDEGWRVQQALLLLKSEFERGLKSRQGAISNSPLSTAVLESVLDYIRVHHKDAYAAESQTPLPAPVVRALAVMRDRLAQDIDVADLAAAAGVSDRSLFHQFSEFLGASPMRCLEAKRLAHARALLLAGHRPVHSAARASGFRHMGRFSQSYAKAYGEKPSETLSKQ